MDRRGRHRRGDGALCRHDRPRPERHQEGPGLFDGQPARLHVPGAGRGRLRRRHLPRDDARLLQGAALPRLRLGDPRHARGAGHPEDGGTEASICPSRTGRSSSGRSPSPGSRRSQGSSARTRSSGRRSPAGTGLLWLLGLAGAGLTAFYMFRLVSLTFDGEKRWASGEAPARGPVDDGGAAGRPCGVAVGRRRVRWAIPPSLGGGNAIEHWLEPVFAPALEKLAAGAARDRSCRSTSLMVLSVGGRRWRHLARAPLVRRSPADAGGPRDHVSARAYGLLLNKYYVDECTKRRGAPAAPAIRAPPVEGLDVGVIDWTVNALARAHRSAESTVRMVQTGIAQNVRAGVPARRGGDPGDGLLAK